MLAGGTYIWSANCLSAPTFPGKRKQNDLHVLVVYGKMRYYLIVEKNDNVIDVSRAYILYCLQL